MMSTAWQLKTTPGVGFAKYVNLNIGSLDRWFSTVKYSLCTLWSVNDIPGCVDTYHTCKYSAETIATSGH